MITPLHLLIHTAYVINNNVSIIAGDVEYEETEPTAIQCRVQILSGAEALRQGTDRTKYAGKLYTLPTAVIYEDDNIVFENKEWKVTSVRLPDSMNVLLTADIERPKVVREDGF